MAGERITVHVPSEVMETLAHLARRRGDYDKRSTREDGLALGPAGAEAMVQGAEILAALKGPGADGKYGNLTTEELAARLYGVTLALTGFLASAGKPLPMSIIVAQGATLPGVAPTPAADTPQGGAISLSDDLNNDAGNLGIGLLDD